MVTDSAAERSAGLVRAWEARRLEADAGVPQQEEVASAPTGSAGDATSVLPPSQGQDAGAVVDGGARNSEPAPAVVGVSTSTVEQVALGSPARSV